MTQFLKNLARESWGPHLTKERAHFVMSVCNKEDFLPNKGSHSLIMTFPNKGSQSLNSK